MMTRPILRRRSLIATATSGAVAWLGAYASFLPGHAGRAYSISGYSELIALCSDLRCPKTIGKACLLALPAAESTLSSLAQTVLSDVRLVGGDHPPRDMLAQAIKEQSRTDFRDGRVVTVDGWVLSLTETRVYALTVLLPEPGVHAT